MNGLTAQYRLTYVRVGVMINGFEGGVMDTSIIYVTAKGKKILEARLEELVAKREEISHSIREAREFGDLKENAEYAAAREAQSNLEDEIIQVQERLANCKLFSYQKANTACVSLGTCVKIQVVGGAKTQEWTITGIIETDPLTGHISNESPLGKSLLGKKVGEIVEVHTPAGVTKFKVISIKPGA